MALTTESAARKDARNARAGTFEHRHFSTIAAIIKDMTGEDFEGLRGTIARRFADELSGTNPRFDRSRFLAACGESV